MVGDMVDEFIQFDFDDIVAENTSLVAPVVSVASQANRLQYLIDNTPAIIYTSVPTGDFKMTFVSGNAFHVLGFHPEEMLADPNFWFDHIHPDDVPLIFSSIAMLFTEGKQTYEYRFKSSSGEYVWMHDMLKLIKDDAGNPIEVVGSLTDITKRKEMECDLQKKAEEQRLLIEELHSTQGKLLEAEKMASVGQLAAGVAHEINNPIGFVNSNMNSLKDYVTSLFEVLDQYDNLVKKFPPDHDVTKRFKDIRVKADLVFLREDIQALVSESVDGLKRVKNIVQSLKDFAIDEEIIFQESDLHLGINTVIDNLGNDISQDVTIIKEYGNLPLINCLITQLKQVFMNIILNAAQSIVGQGNVTIVTGLDRDWIWIKITDTGSGIEAENLSKIFDPFFTTKPVGSGTGLGLSNAYAVVKKHAGRIDVESTLGKGTSFTIHIPVNAAKEINRP
jgi:two-component system NtrC family sensor kinase